MGKNTSSKWLYFPVVLLFINFIYRLIDQSKMLRYFPLDIYNDGSSYMAQLFFLKSCGFHSLCSYWYNGIVTFLHSPPGWYFFTLPIFNVFQSINVSLYISLILILIISFFAIFILYRNFGLSGLERTALFIFFFGNAITVGNFIRLQRVPELFAWMWFIIFFFIIHYFKDKKLDWRYFLVSPIYAFMLISYHSIGIIASLLFLSLFLVKDTRDRIYIVMSFAMSLVISSFWWLPFLLRLEESGLGAFQQAKWLWEFDDLNFFTDIFAVIIPIALGFFAYFYFRSRKDKKNELLFYSPILLLGLLFFFRLHPFLPIFNNIFPDPYLIFFIFFILFFFFKTNFNFTKFSVVIPYILILAVVISVGFNVYRTSFFIDSTDKLSLDVKDTFNNVNGSFVILGDFGRNIYGQAVYSYLPIKYNLTTPFGWYPGAKSSAYILDFHKLVEGAFYSRDCAQFRLNLDIYNATEVIALDEGCKFLESCEFNQKVKKDSVCLYSVN